MSSSRSVWRTIYVPPEGVDPAELTREDIASALSYGVLDDPLVSVEVVSVVSAAEILARSAEYDAIVLWRSYGPELIKRPHTCWHCGSPRYRSDRPWSETIERAVLPQGRPLIVHLEVEER